MFVSFLNSAKPKFKTDKDRYTLTTVKNNGRGKLLLLDFEKSSKATSATSLSAQRRSSKTKVSELYDCLENSAAGVKALVRRPRTGQVLTIIKKRHSKSIAALVFL